MYFTFLRRGVISTNLLLVSLFSFSPTGLNAIELNDFVVDSISAHPTIREQVHVFREVSRDHDIADSGWLPSIDLEASAGNYETKSPATGLITRDYASHRAELSVTQNLFNGFDTQNQQKQTQARLNSALYEIFDTADNIALNAVQAYLDVVKQSKLVELAETNVGSHERILSQIRERNDSGVGRRSELQQTEGRVARAHASLLAQQNNLQDAVTALHEMLGRYMEFSKLNTPHFPAHPGKTLNELIDQALEQHPAIKVASFNVESALSDSSRAKSNYYPKVDLRLAKEIGDDLNGLNGETDELSLVLNLRYNLYRGGADRADQRKKISVVHQNQAFASRVHRQVINSLRLAWAADQSLSQQLEFLTVHIEKSRQTVASYGEEFFIGQRDLIDLLDAESELNSAQNQYTDAYYEALAARYRILEAMGALFPALSLEVSVGEDDIQISKIQGIGNDVLPLDLDRDVDKEKTVSDHCDNTLENDTVSEFGCHQQPKMMFGYTRNQSPVPGDDQLELEMNSILVIPQAVLLENDTDADGDTLKLVSFTQPKNGAIAFDEMKNLIYKSTEGFIGNDHFVYNISDGQGVVVAANVKIIISPRTDMALTKTQYVNFVYKKSVLTPVSQTKIKDIVNRIKHMRYTQVEIFAYTDDIGSDGYNLKLSDRRAQALQKLLVELGLDNAKIREYGMGEKNPIADNSTPAGQAINRRGELHFKFSSNREVEIPNALLKRKIPTESKTQ